MYACEYRLRGSLEWLALCSHMRCEPPVISRDHLHFLNSNWNSFFKPISCKYVPTNFQTYQVFDTCIFAVDKLETKRNRIVFFSFRLLLGYILVFIPFRVTCVVWIFRRKKIKKKNQFHSARQKFAKWAPGPMWPGAMWANKSGKSLTYLLARLMQNFVWDSCKLVCHVNYNDICCVWSLQRTCNCLIQSPATIAEVSK